MLWIHILLGVVTGYLLGNLNGAVSISTLLKDDVRSHGSGNAGLTNFIRNYGRGKALYVIVVDAVKAVAACLVGGYLLEPFGMYDAGVAIGGTAVMFGHVFPVLLGFRGGKGILSGLFIGLTADWRIGVIALAVFCILYFTTRYVSLSSVIGSMTYGACFVIFFWGDPVVVGCGLFMTALTLFMHRSNVARLLSGKETKTNLFAKGKAE